MKNCCDNTHPSHQEETGRLNRIIGQVEGIKKMIEEQRYCPDIIIQLRAIQSAGKAVETNILQRHLESCVKEVFQLKDKTEQTQKLKELINIFKKNN